MNRAQKLRPTSLLVGLLVGLLAGLLLLACGEDEGDDGGTGPGDGHPPAELVDSWEYASVTVNGTGASLATVLDWVAGAASARFHVFRSDGTFSYEEVNGSGGQLFVETGFIFIDGDEMDVNILAMNGVDIIETQRYDWNLAGDVLTLSRTQGSDTYVFTLNRI